MKHGESAGVAMATSGPFRMSDTTVNMVENLACQLSEFHSGKVYPNYLIPYLPLSLDMIRECLENMVDSSAVVKVEPAEGLAYYLFSAFDGSTPKEGAFSPRECVACSCDLLRGSESAFCSKCLDGLMAELNSLAETTGWPAQAVYEHEILYLAARHEGPHYADSLAGRSRLTLRRMKQKLAILHENGYVSQSLTEEKGLLGYDFPQISYPKDPFQRNMGVIRGYPASLMEELEVKVVQIFLALSALVLAMFAGIWILKIPYPLAVLTLVVSGPVLAFLIWRHKSKVIDD